MMIKDFIEPWQYTLNDKVDNGVAWLDEHYPTWYRSINVEVLELSSGSSCVCGQVFATMWQQNEVEHECDCPHCTIQYDVEAEHQSGWDWFTENHTNLNGEDLGFENISSLYECGVIHDYDHECGEAIVPYMRQYSYLTEEWSRRVEKKLADSGMIL